MEVRRKLAGWVLAGLALLPGCVSGDKRTPEPNQPPEGPVAQVQSLWQSRVFQTPDPVHKGMMIPGLAGRVYLLTSDPGHNVKLPEGMGVKANGKVMVDLYDKVQSGADGQPRLLEHYEFPPQVLAQL